MATRIAGQAGVMAGDLPAMMAGGMGGGALAEKVGVGTVKWAMNAFQGAGAFALPTAIRDIYADAIQNGSVKSSADFAARLAAITWDTAKSGAVGAATGVAGLAGELAKSGVGQFAAKTSAELAAMTGVGAALEMRLPKPEDFIDNAVMIAAFHGARAVTEGLTAKKVVAATDVKPIIANLADHFKETGESPSEALTRAMNDPAFAQRLIVERRPAA